MTVLKFGLAATTALILGGCVAVPVQPYDGPYGRPYDGRYESEAIVIAPPAPRYEYLGPPPVVGHFWIDGYWSWSGGRHVWVPGRWEAPRRGYAWVPHRWDRDGDRWREAPGHWERGEHRPDHRGDRRDDRRDGDRWDQNDRR